VGGWLQLSGEPGEVGDWEDRRYRGGGERHGGEEETKSLLSGINLRYNQQE
jgi:hypothetical protein